ncbi:heme o synthase [Thalassotalea psychrophila]|uniref:Protoheme IX farnesyltransferase n=1 Tax=Thalassotalea psychrophila TaxID=3065647 RepID=A0ABY9TP63_9GAMM|nr:heme o synthase [Colwelliaceae bacterium SQ149]
MVEQIVSLQKKFSLHAWAYFEMCKPKVVLMLLITAFVGMQLTPNLSQDTSINRLSIMFIALIGIGFAASAAAIINHLVDVNIDSKMVRTHKRPMVVGSVNSNVAKLLATVLAFTSMTLLIVYVNALTALLTFAGLIGYAFIYSLYLKHTTPQNIVIGGLSGALPPLLGWTAMTNEITLNGIVLLAIIFFWTPAHFWALAIDRIEDYKKAKVPMLPVVKGIPYTKNCVIVYTLLTILVSYIPVITGMSGYIYSMFTAGLSAWFLYSAVKLKFFPNSSSAIKCFYVSIYYLLGLFMALLVDHYWFIFIR